MRGLSAAAACALAAALLAAPAGADVAPPRERPDAGAPRDGGARPPDSAEARPDGGPRAPSPPDPDPELLRHLEEIQKLELLQNLELFDDQAP